jgi:MOSC domain-containing protein YiiM
MRHDEISSSKVPMYMRCWDENLDIGDVRLRGIEPTRPCHIPSAAANKTGFKEAYSNRGGVRAEILSDGIISVGDAISGDNISVLPT